MSESRVDVERRGPVAWVWMNKPEVHNAFEPALIEELTAGFEALGASGDVRAIVLAGRGRNFSAGASMEWMRQQGKASAADNIADARRLASLFSVMAESPKPTLARVHGAAMGGGLGLVAACDLAVGATGAVFATPEVRLGLIPATIAPYVVRAIGERQARRLFLTGERIDAMAAQKMGLLHEVVEAERLDERVNEMVQSLLAGAPCAQSAAKSLIRAVAEQALTPELIEDTAQRIAGCRAQEEAAEGLNAFLEKRSASWVVSR